MTVIGNGNGCGKWLWKGGVVHNGLEPRLPTYKKSGMAPSLKAYRSRLYIYIYIYIKIIMKFMANVMVKRIAIVNVLMSLFIRAFL